MASAISPLAASSPSEVTVTVPKTRGDWSNVLRRFLEDRIAGACAVILLLLILAALFAPLLHLAAPYRARRLRPIGTEGLPFGSDEQGRDMLARLIYGGRLTLLIGLLPVVFAFFIATALGVTAGYVGGWVNTVIMRTVDIFFAFPSVLLAIA